MNFFSAAEHFSGVLELLKSEQVLWETVIPTRQYPLGTVRAFFLQIRNSAPAQVKQRKNLQDLDVKAQEERLQISLLSPSFAPYLMGHLEISRGTRGL